MVSAAIERGLDMRRLFVLPALFLFSPIGFSASGADFQKGFDAYNKGNYATALRKWVWSVSSNTSSF